MICKKDLVYWNDPAIYDYPEEERDEARNRAFVVDDVIDGTALISEVNGCTTAEVPIHELELMPF